MAENAGKRRVLLEHRAMGRTIRQAAQAAGYHERTAERIVASPGFQADLQRLVDQLAEEQRHGYLEHRRNALLLGNQALLTAQSLLASTATPAVQERAARTVLAHLRHLFPGPDEIDVEDQLRLLEQEVHAKLRGGGERHLWSVPEAPDYGPAG
jgi:hypothetical protein